MMSTAQDHYDRLLGSVYTWMAGGFEAAVTRSRQLFDLLGIASWPRGLAVDLGCGSGFQAVPLAEAGFEVLALDLCEPLLAELRIRAGELPIRIVREDLANFPNHLPIAPHLIVCMGDTLTHLSSVEAVTDLFRDIARTLAPGGRLILSFRDLATHALEGPQRFIPVRCEPDQIFTCFLDYHPEHVEVNDLLHTRSGGQWNLKASSYRKLRLSGPLVCKLIAVSGLLVEHSSTEQGLVKIVARN